MEKNVRYPIEAFAVACVLFSTGMKAAMLTGIAVVFGHILLNVLLDNMGSSMKMVSGVVSGVLTAAAMIGLCMVGGVETSIFQKIAAVVVGLLMVKHAMDTNTETDYNDLLLADALAYAGMVIVAIVSEYISSGSVYTMAMKHTTLMSPELGRAMIAVAFAGIILGIVNKIADSDCAKDAGLWACLPVAVLNVACMADIAEAPAKAIITIIIVVAVYLASRTLLKFSDNKENMEGVPVEMVLLGLICLVAAIV
ncbi:MAG: hypothetical protein MJ117_07790 [Lachnospiraceae bacterium]|nr:hypothetical protein [Lachnospiraceae bacterium]